MAVCDMYCAFLENDEVVEKRKGINCRDNVICESEFHKMDNLYGISFSKNISQIGYGAFANCKTLRKVSFVGNIKDSKKKDAFQIAYGAFRDCPTLDYVDFYVCEMEIKESAFEGCEGLEYVKTSLKPNSNITKIGPCAFANCASLRAIFLPPSVKDIGERAFEGCTTLIDVKISKQTKVASNAFPSWLNVERY